MLVNKVTLDFEFFPKRDVMSYHWDCHQCFVNFPMCFLKASSSTCSGSRDFLTLLQMPPVWTRTQSETRLCETELTAAARGLWLCCTRSKGLPDEQSAFMQLEFSGAPRSSRSHSHCLPDTSVHLSLGICGSSVAESCHGYWSWPLGSPTRLVVCKHLVITFISGSIHNVVLCVCVFICGTLFNTCCWFVNGSHGQRHWHCNWCLSEGYLLYVFPL